MVAVTSTRPLDGCTAVTGCAIAVSSSAGGHPDAGIAAADRFGGTAGAAMSVAIVMAGDATSAFDVRSERGSGPP